MSWLHEIEHQRIVAEGRPLLRPQFLSEEEAAARFKLDQYDPLGLLSFSAYVLLDGDIEIDGNLEGETLEELFSSEEGPRENHTLYIVAGNLKVNGEIYISESMPCLLVTGDVYCEVLHSFDNVIQICSDAYIKYAFNGNYNHGSITVQGTTHVPFLLNSDHDSRLNPSDETISINYYSDWDDFFIYDYYASELSDVLIKQALADGEFDYDRFIKVLRSGKSPLKKGAKPGRVLVEESIEKLSRASKAGKGARILDLTSKKLRSLPESIFELESLEELILEDNGFDRISESLGNLVNLRVLNLRKTGIEALPATIGQLKKLEELNLSYCSNLRKLPAEIGNLENLKTLTLWCYNGSIPEEIKDLTKLEELDIYGWYQQVSEPVAFPRWVFRLKNLKSLKIKNNSWQDIPDDILGLTKLETLHLSSALCYVPSLPDLSNLKNLKGLEADGRVGITTRPPVQYSRLQDYFNIESLESLKIDAYGAEERYLNAATFSEMVEKLKEEPAKLEAFKKSLRVEETEIAGRKLQKYFLRSRREMKPEDLNGISRLQNLKDLDLAWNDLEGLPSEIFQLKNLKRIRLYGNQIPQEQVEELKVQCPGIEIE